MGKKGREWKGKRKSVRRNSEEKGREMKLWKKEIIWIGEERKKWKRKKMEGEIGQ